MVGAPDPDCLITRRDRSLIPSLGSPHHALLHHLALSPYPFISLLYLFMTLPPIPNHLFLIRTIMAAKLSVLYYHSPLTHHDSDSSTPDQRIRPLISPPTSKTHLSPLASITNIRQFVSFACSIFPPTHKDLNLVLLDAFLSISFSIAVKKTLYHVVLYTGIPSLAITCFSVSWSWSTFLYDVQ